MNRKIMAILFCFILVITFANTTKADIKSNIKNDNSPPNPPIVNVPDSIIRGKTFKITMVTIDPDGDNVSYRVDIKFLYDIWSLPIPSGTEFIFWVNLRVPLGVYTLGVQAKDDYGAESEWTYVQFNVTKVRTYNNIFLNFLESHPNQFPVLQKLL